MHCCTILLQMYAFRRPLVDIRDDSEIHESLDSSMLDPSGRAPASLSLRVPGDGRRVKSVWSVQLSPRFASVFWINHKFIIAINQEK